MERSKVFAVGALGGARLPTVLGLTPGGEQWPRTGEFRIGEGPICIPWGDGHIGIPAGPPLA
jgi:hypothetical protein